MSDNTQELREEWRNWLASHGLPHNEVEGDLILDFIEALLKSQTNQAVVEARIDELERTAKYAGAWMNPSTGERTSNWVNMEVVNSRLSTLRQELTQEVQTDE